MFQTRKKLTSFKQLMRKSTFLIEKYTLQDLQQEKSPRKR